MKIFKSNSQIIATVATFIGFITVLLGAQEWFPNISGLGFFGVLIGTLFIIHTVVRYLSLWIQIYIGRKKLSLKEAIQLFPSKYVTANAISKIAKRSNEEELKEISQEIEKGNIKHPAIITSVKMALDKIK